MNLHAAFGWAKEKEMRCFSNQVQNIQLLCGLRHCRHGVFGRSAPNAKRHSHLVTKVSLVNLVAM